jgi:AcrR family transcriptional regulator
LQIKERTSRYGIVYEARLTGLATQHHTPTEKPMHQQRRGPGRPAYDSKQKLVAAASALLAERGYEATSPKMILDRAGIGQGSLYHHYDGKEALAIDAISHLRDRSLAYLEGRATTAPAGRVDELEDAREAGTDTAAVLARIEATLDQLFTRTEGRALIRLLADPTVAASKTLTTVTETWCDDLRTAILATLDGTDTRDPEIAEAAAAILAPELNALAHGLLAAALGRGLVVLPRT